MERICWFSLRYNKISMVSCNQAVNSENYADFIYRYGNISLELIRQQTGTDCISYVDEEYVILHAPLDQVLPITLARYSYSSIPALYTLLDSTNMEQSGILPVMRQPGLNTGGEGVLLGIIDTGIDYRNPLFRNTDGTTRILGIWDQTATGSFSMESSRGASYEFLYGKEYRKEQIDEALASTDPLSLVPVTDDSGHGTFLAGIAAGRTEEDADFTGAAPSCSLGIVKLHPAKQYLRDYYQIPASATAYQSNDIMTAITYLRFLSYRHQMPLVICLSLGTNQGSHDGTSPLSQTLNHLNTLRGVCSVCSAGNEVGFRHHCSGVAAEDSSHYTEIELRTGEGESGFQLELWASFPEFYTIGLVSPTGQATGRIPYGSDNHTTIRFPLEQTDVTVSYLPASVTQNTSLVVLRFQTPAAGIWKIQVYPSRTISGIFHLWLPAQGLVSPDTFFLNSDPSTTITDPGNAAFPITAAACDHTNGSLYIHSSRGYTRDGRIKPDLAAPGVDVYGPGISSVPGDFPYTRMTGSSIAAAHVAGAAACLYSWGYVKGNEPSINSRSIKAYLTLGADRIAAYRYPNPEWGYGMLNLYQSFLAMRE